MTWQPIATAPKDATPIIAVDYRNGRVVDLNVAVWLALYSEWMVEHGPPLGPHAMHPTHWMPLPEVP